MAKSCKRFKTAIVCMGVCTVDIACLLVVFVMITQFQMFGIEEFRFVSCIHALFMVVRVVLRWCESVVLQACSYGRGRFSAELR